MIYMWFTGINYHKLAVEKDRDSIFTTITTIWKPGFRESHVLCVTNETVLLLFCLLICLLAKWFRTICIALHNISALQF